MMRINKFIARSGYTSRRKADELIKNGLVKVNYKIIKEPGIDVKENDLVEVDGQILEIEDKFYLKLYKPVGFITSNFDPYNDKDLNNLLDLDKRFFAAGRLDKDSEGLLIITNDGDFTNEIIHPSKKLDKTYIVKVSKLLNNKEISLFEKGIDIGNGEVTSDSKIVLIDKKTNKYKVTIHQGYNRQIRRMFEYFSSKVINLKRISIGPIQLSNMKPYETRQFTADELEFVKQVMG
ncbi:pseudouridylate synthase [Anaerococcus tetradius ATCC 35098]|uniref:Pseudouridine synthase n=2 Tax=Anaerococcus tetradius TaxID=33036 RepID=C2CFD4_9FIRM|nr:pseudouridylate synthase [Anaerococcus tetradius ATCC 35098]